MNKSLRLLLFLGFVLFACFNSRQGDVSSHPGANGKLSLATAQQQRSTLCGKNDTNNKKKNAIRIKAWDDVAVVVLPATWTPLPRVFYVFKPFCFYYNEPTLCPKFSRDKLRGPPTA